MVTGSPAFLAEESLCWRAGPSNVSSATLAPQREAGCDTARGQPCRVRRKLDLRESSLGRRLLDKRWKFILREVVFQEDVYLAIRNQGWLRG